MNILRTLSINGTTYNVAPVVPASSVTLLAAAWVGDGDAYSQVVELPGVTPHTKVDLQPTSDQLAEFHYKVLAFVAENNGGVVTVYAIGDKPSGDHTIQTTLTEVEATGKIRGNTVGTPMPRSNFNQTDPKKADYIVGREKIVQTVNGIAPDENGNVEVKIPEGGGGNVDLTGYATEQYVKDYAQPVGNYLTEVPSGYATEEFVTNKIAEAELGGEEVDLSGYAQKSEIPTKVSQLQNDKGYLTEHQDLSGYAKTSDIPTKPEDIGAQPSGNYALKTEIPSVPVKSVNGKTGAVSLSASDVGARPSTWMPSASDVGALPASTTIPTKTSQLTNDSGFIKSYTETDPTVPSWAKASTKPSYSKSEVGLGNVDNVKQYSANNPPPYPVTSVNGKTGAVSLTIPTVPTKVSAFTNDAGYLTQHQDISGKLDASALPTAINTALAQAKASGEFDGEDGQRGTGLLAVTTAPSSYTTAVGGITPKYRMALSTIKTQAGVTEVLLGDTIRYSYYQYPIAYLDASYAYCTTRVSLRGTAGTTPVKGEDYFTDADKEEFLAGVDAVRYVPQNLTEAQKAQARANIGASAGEDVEFADSIEWLNAYGDTNKKYVLPDGYIYTYTQKSVTVTHNANDGTCSLNVRPTPNKAIGNNTTNNGYFSTAAIPIDNTWGDCIVNLSGVEKFVENFYSTFYVFFYKADGTWLGYQHASQFGFSATSQTLPITVNIRLASDLTYWNQASQVRMAFAISTSAITNDTVKNFVINFERLNTEETAFGWYSTGQLHSNDKATQQNSADIATLKEDVATLKAIAGASAGGSGAKWYAIGDSITYGLYSTSASDYSQPVIGKRWVDYVAQYNGYTLTNLGVSGSGFVTGTTFRTVVDRNNFASVDLVTIMLGINDWKNEAAVNKVGTMSDAVGTAYTDKIIPELRYGIEKIISQNPYCKIILITPINAKIGSRGTESTNWAYEFSGSITPCGSLKNFNDKLKEVCEYYGIQVVDMTNSSVVNRKSITTILPDGIHPNLDCYKALGLELARKITFA